MDLVRLPQSRKKEFRPGNDVLHHSFIQIRTALVFGKISDRMAFGQNSPGRGRNAERVRKDLEHKISILRAIPQTPQPGERQGVGGVVGQIESALQREIQVLRVDESNLTRMQEAFDFPWRRRLPLELPDLDEILEFRRGHSPIRSRKAS